MGPVDLIVVKFSNNQFSGDVIPALTDLVSKDVIRVIDLLFIRKDADGTVTSMELDDLDDRVFNAFNPLMTDQTGLLGDEDVQRFAEALPNNSSAGMMVFENVWAKRLSDAIVQSNGELLYNERIPRAVIDELLANAQVPATPAAQAESYATGE